MARVETIFGIDFSAASDDAGRKTWIAEGSRSDDSFVIESVQPVDEKLGCESDRESTFRRLRTEIATADQKTVYGLDFPFSLPAKIVIEDEWTEFLEQFPSNFAGPEDFRATCHRWTNLVDGEAKELQRECESAHGGLCAYNLWIHKMTYYGIQDLLRPLRLSESVRVLPFDRETGGSPTVIETYPAATLEVLEFDRESYKGSSGSSERREELLSSIHELQKVNLALNRDELDRIRADEGGDALDSVLAAIGVYHGLAKGIENPDEYADRPNIEGHIYA